MDYSLTFARHFARMVWLLLNEGNAFDAQIATLRSLVNVSRDGDVRLHAQDWRLMANGQPLPDRFTGAQDLVAQLIGHSVRALRVSQGASPADLLLAARVLASEAAPDDGGRNVLSRLAALNASTVHVEIDGTVADTVAAVTAAAGVAPIAPAVQAVRAPVEEIDDIIAITAEEDLYGAASLAGYTERDPSQMLARPSHSPVTPSMIPAIELTSSLMPTPPKVTPTSAPPLRSDIDPAEFGRAEPRRSNEHRTDELVIMRGADPESMLQASASPSAQTPKGSMVKMFEALDAANNSAAAARQLESLVKLATESARKERVDMVADVFYGILKRDSGIEDKSFKRQYAMSIRRLATPAILQCIVELLPRRRENYEQYMLIFDKSDEAGVEALVEALVAAPSITDRRVYYDALLRLRTGIRTLMFMLGDPRWYVVRNAAELLGEMKSTEAEPDLTKLLQHRDDRVRTAAASSLAKLGGTAAVRGMRASLRDAGEAVKERVVDAMGSREGNSVDSLIRAVDREEDNRVQMAMLAALGQLGTPAAVEKLLEVARSDKKLLARSRPTPMRVAAVHALGDVKNHAALGALQALLQDKEKAVRGAASWVIMGRRRENGQWPDAGGLPVEDDES